MIRLLRPAAGERHLLPDTRMSGPVPWMLAIMMLMTILAAAATLAIGNAVERIGDTLERQVTIQIVEANPDVREVQRQAVLRRLKALPEISAIHEIGEAEMAQLLAPWLGAGALDRDMPLPVMIDATIAQGVRLDPAALATAIRADAPAARVNNNAGALLPVADLLGTIRSLAIMIMGLMLVAIMSAIMLAVRGALNTHRATIDVMHLIGANDYQIARHFQRRAAIDALVGGVAGLAAAAGVMALLAYRVGAMRSELAGSAGLGWVDWIVLALIPVLGALIAALVARMTVLRALRKML